MRKKFIDSIELPDKAYLYGYKSSFSFSIHVDIHTHGEMSEQQRSNEHTRDNIRR